MRPGLSHSTFLSNDNDGIGLGHLKVLSRDHFKDKVNAYTRNPQKM